MPEARLPLVSMVVPALRRLSRDQFDAFATGVRDLVQADNQVSLYEYALQRLLLRHLASPYGQTRPTASRGSSVDALDRACKRVLGTLAHVGSAVPSDAARAYALSLQALNWPGVDPSLPPRDLDLCALDQALNQLDDAAPPLKKQILAACATCIGADGQITLEEGELLRAIADSLGCPIPPLRALPGAEMVAADPL